MTWHGKLGFQEAPQKDFNVPLPRGCDRYGKDRRCNPWVGEQGIMGKQHFERGLQWVHTYQSGHELPMYQPRAAWRHLQWMLGRIDEL